MAKASNVPGAFDLNIQTVTIVPSTKSKSQSISNDQFQNRVMQTRRMMSRLFGGYTSVKGVGGFLFKKKVIRERVVFVTAFATEDSFRKNKARWIKWVRGKKRAWGQESMGIIIENDMRFI